MKLSNISEAVEVVGDSGISNFSIAVNGKAFRVLSDTLYKNKIGSIVREISCNAYDAHVMAGNTERPFEIHLPDDFEPWFSVKDYGVGLSPEDIATVFTVYFQSTKDQSNDAIGAFGLGAKTPFSYTDQFTVTSVKNGKKYVYSAFITESGVPSIAEMHTEETEEENGVEIRMSVKREDYHTFAKEVVQQLKYFKVKPIVQNREVKFEEVKEPILSTESGNIYEGYSNNTYTIIQGNVGYVASISELNGKINPTAYAFINSLINYTAKLNFNIGEIGVTASREGVEYDKNTLKNIENKIEKFQKECLDFVKSKIASLDNDWDKAAFITSNTLYSSLVNIKFGNSNIEGGVCILDLKKENDFERISTVNLSRIMRAYMHPIKAIDKVSGDTKYHHRLSVLDKNRVIIFIKDKSSLLTNRIRYYFSNKSLPYNGFMITPAPDETADELILKLKKQMGGFDNFKKLSEIELPKVARNKSAPSTFYRDIYNNSSRMYDWVKEQQPLADIEDETVYVTYENMYVTNALTTSKFQTLKKIFGNKIPSLIAIKVKDVVKAEKNENLIPINEFLVKKQKEIITSVTPEMKKKYFRHGISSYIASNSVDYKFRGLLNHQFQGTLATVYPDSKLVKVGSLIQKYAGSVIGSDEMYMCEYLGLKEKRQDYQEKLLNKIRKYIGSIGSQYPMLEAAFEGYSYSKYYTQIAEYIKMIDSQ